MDDYQNQNVFKIKNTILLNFTTLFLLVKYSFKTK